MIWGIFMVLSCVGLRIGRGEAGNSTKLAQGKDYTFYSCDSDHHLFREEERNLAVSREVSLFRSLMKDPAK